MLDHDTAYYAEYSILDQCIPHGGVLDIKVDRRSQQGCVYVKMESIQAAAGAYRALHGAWYKRALHYTWQLLFPIIVYLNTVGSFH